jgi:hypothetical protein
MFEKEPEREGERERERENRSGREPSFNGTTKLSCI